MKSPYVEAYAAFGRSETWETFFEMADDSGFRMKLLMGAENHYSWLLDVKGMLQGKALVDALTQDPLDPPPEFVAPTDTHIPETATASQVARIEELNESRLLRAMKEHERLEEKYEQNRLMHQKALGAVISKISPALRREVAGCTTAKEVLQHFHDSFRAVRKLNYSRYIFQLADVMKKPKESVRDYFERIQEMVDALADMGSKQEPAYVKSVAVKGLDKALSHMETHLRHKLTDDTFSFIDLRTELLAEEAKLNRTADRGAADRQQQQQQPASSAFNAAAAGGKSKHKNMICYKCGRKGHIRPFCKFKGPTKGGGKNGESTAAANAVSPAGGSEKKREPCGYCGRPTHSKEYCYLKKKHDKERSDGATGGESNTAAVLSAEGLPAPVQQATSPCAAEDDMACISFTAAPSMPEVLENYGYYDFVPKVEVFRLGPL